MLLAACLVVFLSCQTGSSQNLGDACVIVDTNLAGVCKQAPECESAREAYQNNAIWPTYCSLTSDTPVVCCSDGISFSATPKPVDQRTLWKQLPSEVDRDKHISEKMGDACVMEDTNLAGVCKQASECDSAREAYQNNGIRPTYCSLTSDTPLVCCSDGISFSATPKPVDQRTLWKQLPSEVDRDKHISEKMGDACVIEDTNLAGVCKQASECESAREAYQNNGIRPTYCSLTSDTPLVCCTDGISFSATPKPVDRTTLWKQLPSEVNRDKRISEKKCDEYSRGVTKTVGFIPLVTDPETISISTPKCNYEKTVLIVGGEDAHQGEFPHMAAIAWVDDEGNYAFWCGGSLISPRFVLTAGHCSNNPRIKQKKPVIVRLGDQNLDTSVSDGASPIDVPIKRIHKHPLYKPPSKYNDIALFELNVDVDFEATIRPACLWTKPNFPGYTKAVATGWGATSRGNVRSNELQKVSLTLLKNDYCDDLLRNIHNRQWSGFIPSQMCAGELRGGKDTCQGDSGSPLQVASLNNKCVFRIVGITSFGHRCAESGKPAVYTRVSEYLDWIESIVWPGEQ